MLYQACNMKVFLSQPYNSFHIYSTDYIPFARSSLWISLWKLIPSFFHSRGFSVWYHLDTDSTDSYCVLVVYGAELHRKFVSVDLCDWKASCMELQGAQETCNLVNCSDQQFHEGQKLRNGSGVASTDLLGKSYGSITSFKQSSICFTYCLSSSYVPAILKPPLSHFQTWAEIKKF